MGVILVSYLGERRSYYQLLSHYETVLSKEPERTLGSRVAEVFPRLSAGVMFAALHPLIHIGYGLAENHEGTVAEGLAYLHHSYKPFREEKPAKFEFGAGTLTLAEVLEEIRRDDDLYKAMAEGAKSEKVKALKCGGFQSRCYLLLQRGDEIMG